MTERVAVSSYVLIQVRPRRNIEMGLTHSTWTFSLIFFDLQIFSFLHFGAFDRKRLEQILSRMENQLYCGRVRKIEALLTVPFSWHISQMMHLLHLIPKLWSIGSWNLLFDKMRHDSISNFLILLSEELGTRI